MSQITCSTCPYCGVGCGVSATYADDRLISIQGDGQHPANAGRLCVKGSHLQETLIPDGRLRHPVVDGVVTDWETAAAAVAQGLEDVVAEHGPDAVAFYLSGQLLTEDYYVANKLLKGFIGSANVDTNSRLCMASAVAAHKRAFGEDVVPCDYADLEQCDLLVLCGSNTAWAHPIVYQRIVAAKAARNMRVVVIDPRRTATCDIADLHLPLRPGSDAALFNALLTYLVDHNAVDGEFVEMHTDGSTAAFEANQLDLQAAAQLTGLDAKRLQTFFAWFADTPRTVTLFSQGVNQAANGTDRANAIINCHLATGRIGQLGMGPFSITGQPNAMGGREVGGLANQLAAHMDFSAKHVADVGAFWGSGCIPEAPGLKAVDMFEAVRDGRIKAIWIMGTNPAVSLPDSHKVRAALATCPLVIVSDCIAQTDTARYANVLLPAQGWGEKDGTVTNSERCISRQRRLVPPQGDARADWDIVCDVARRMGYAHAFDFQAPWQIFAEHASLSRWRNDGARLFDLSFLGEIDAERYEQMPPTVWPADTRPFANKQFSTASGRAQFIATRHQPPQQLTNAAYPLVLNSGRLRDQWHTMTRTGLVPKLWLHRAAPHLQIHPVDAKRLHVHDQQLVEVRSSHGSVRLLAECTEQVQPGQVFAPIHWTDQQASAAVVSAVFAPVVDPVSGQPESKHAAVAVAPVLVNAWVRLVSVHDLLPGVRSCNHVHFWSQLPALDTCQIELGVDDVVTLLRHLRLQPRVEFSMDRSHRWLGGTDAAPWIMFSAPSRVELPDFELLRSQLASEQPRWQRLSRFSATAGDTSPVVCSCFEVRRAAIEAAIADGLHDVGALGDALRCGTNCGSCVPELNTLLAAQATQLGVAAV